MKRVIISLFFIIAGASLAFSQDNSEEVIIIFEDQAINPDASLRVPAYIPLSCSYYPSLETAHLTFLSDLGTSTITVTQLSEGSVNYYVQDGAGLCAIPLASHGLTIIDIYTETGHHYRSIFIA